MSVRSAFEAYLSDTERVERDIRSSTNAAYHGSTYFLELFHDGTCRVLWSVHVGNRYHTPGLMLVIPSLCEDEEASDDNSADFFENAIAALRAKGEEALAGMEMPQEGRV